MPETPENPIVFTDLDGTLLDHHTYDFSPAQEMLEYIRSKQIPLILTTSKTALECELLCEKLAITTPMIVENGAGIIFNKTDPLYAYANDDGVMRLGASYDEILTFYQQLQEDHEICGFNEMSDEDVVKYTGLPLLDARRAKKRQFTEPFLLNNLNHITAIETKAKAHGLKVVKGGRFFHIVSELQCKSVAMNRLVELYEDFYHQSFTSIALGDSANDKQMIEHADMGIVIIKHDGSFMQCDGEAIRYSSFAGPKGWNASLKEVLLHA